MGLEAKIAHLGFIQNVITRMGSNSFLLKGWSVTLVAAIFALSAEDANPQFILLAYFPVIVFWGLDGYFLHQEKLFRKLYEEVATSRINNDTFTMDISKVKNMVSSLPKVIFSKTLLIFHGAIVAIILLAMFAIIAP